MEIRSYNSELSLANILFKRLFSNIVITRKKGNETKEIPVKCIIGNRSRILKNLENPTKSGLYSLPMIVIQRNGLNRNAERLTNLHNEIVKSPSRKSIIYDLYTPVPIDIEYSVTLISKYPGDVDMMLGNFAIFFNSDLFVTCVHPKFKNLKYNSQIIMGDSISEEHPDELSPDQDDLIVTTVNFTFKTYLFGGSEKILAGQNIHVDPDTGLSTVYDGYVPIILKISADFHAVPRYDVTLPQVSSYLSTIISVDYETGLSSYVEKEMKTVIPFTYDQEYSFEKYFNDFDSGMFQPDEWIYYDRMRWVVDENGFLTLEQDSKNKGQ